VNLNLAKLLPRSLDYFHYLGSETTPPCAEGVSWYVLQTPVEVSSAQIDKISRAVGFNARPLQKRNDRQVTMNRN
jgi:carbonic anhydrase